MLDGEGYGEATSDEGGGGKVMAYLPLTPPDYVGTPARGERIAGPYRPMNRATRTARQSLMNRPRTVPGVVLCRIRAVNLWRSARWLCHSEP